MRSEGQPSSSANHLAASKKMVLWSLGADVGGGQSYNRIGKVRWNQELASDHDECDGE
jgi:hypothetical protein